MDTVQCSPTFCCWSAKASRLIRLLWLVSLRSDETKWHRYVRTCSRALCPESTCSKLECRSPRDLRTRWRSRSNDSRSISAEYSRRNKLYPRSYFSFRDCYVGDIYRSQPCMYDLCTQCHVLAHLLWSNVAREQPRSLLKCLSSAVVHISRVEAQPHSEGTGIDFPERCNEVTGSEPIRFEIHSSKYPWPYIRSSLQPNFKL